MSKFHNLKPLISGGNCSVQKTVWGHAHWEKQVQAAMYSGLLDLSEHF